MSQILVSQLRHSSPPAGTITGSTWKQDKQNRMIGRGSFARRPGTPVLQCYPVLSDVVYSIEICQCNCNLAIFELRWVKSHSKNASLSTLRVPERVRPPGSDGLWHRPHERSVPSVATLGWSPDEIETRTNSPRVTCLVTCCDCGINGWMFTLTLAEPHRKGKSEHWLMWHELPSPRAKPPQSCLLFLAEGTWTCNSTDCNLTNMTIEKGRQVFLGEKNMSPSCRAWSFHTFMAPRVKRLQNSYVWSWNCLNHTAYIL